ncbi:thioredoxin domain-containing protein 6 isoform X10 [Hirundo rustica]|uniref:thioredoxin domain-containing protein 6 isoform X10 n=1 Tax=Hirundo rustica TaxID=43150 RepID=UPI001A9449F8|nr:thioredoxin domain-containing protein 6 isoform X10 [Hirundo rustica]
MATKKKEVVLQINITSQELWEEMLCLKGLIVVDVFQAWCGPCKPVVNLFQKIRNQVGSDLLHFAVVLELTCELAVPLLLTSVILPPKSGTQRCFPVWGAEVDSIDALEKYRGQWRRISGCGARQSLLQRAGKHGSPSGGTTGRTNSAASWPCAHQI